MLKISNSTSLKYPEAHITTNKNRQKVYGNEIYLNDGTEFEIELNNHTSNVLLAKVKLNGNYISNAGLVLRPGEHVFLERYLDDSKRFRFSTYEVSAENEAAIKNNGLVEIEYYKEYVYRPYYWYSYSNTVPCSTDWNSSVTGGAHFDYSGVDTVFANTSNLNVSDAVCDSVIIETGRVEKGSKSDQYFTYVDMRFESCAFHTDRFHLLPVSQKNRTIDEIREYCSNCGRRHRKSENYCPKCGRKF